MVNITYLKTQNLLGMNFCEEQIHKKHFDFPGRELKRPLNTFCYTSRQLNNFYPFVFPVFNTPNFNLSLHVHRTEANKML